MRVTASRPRQHPRCGPASAALLALVVVTPADGDEHDPANPGTTHQAATGAPVEPCAEGGDTEVLVGTLGAGSTAPSGSARLLLPADDTPEAIFLCLHPNLTCAL